jgi:hypothetical protein
MDKSKFNTYINNLISQEKSVSQSFIRIDNGNYNNDLFGISFNFPEDWFVANKKQIYEAGDNQKLVGEYEYYKDELIFNELPLLFVTKYNQDNDELFGLVSPTLIFDIIPKNHEFNGLSLNDFPDIFNSQERFGYLMLKQYKMTSRGNLSHRNGFDYIKYDIEYLFEHKEIEVGIMVELSKLNIDYGDFFLDFSMTDCKCQNEIETENFKKIEESILLEF